MARIPAGQLIDGRRQPSAGEKATAFSRRASGWIRPGRAPRSQGAAWDPALALWRAVLLVLPLVAALLAFMVYPLVKLFVDSLMTGNGLANYVEALSSSAVRRATVTTLVMSAIVTGTAVVLGGFIAWALRTTRHRAMRLLLWTSVLMPLWMGVVVKNYAFVLLLARNGSINKLLVAMGLIDEPLQLLYTPVAVAIGMVYAMLPYAVFSMYAVLITIDLDLLNAARVMGATLFRSMFSIVLPLALPGIIASSAIVFSISIGFYVTPILLGGAQSPFLASVIDAEIFSYFSYPQAASVSVLLLAIAMVILGVAIKFVGAAQLRRVAL